nr:cytochrome P450 CYP94D108-like isoform X1 [Lolium perenne]
MVLMDVNIALLLLLFLPVLVAVYLRWRRGPAAAASANHCPHPNRILGNTVPFLLNLHRFLDWATDLLAASPASTIEVRGALGLGSGVATASPEVVDHFLRGNFPNYVKGARFAVPFADLLGSGMFLADGRLWSLQRKLASYSFSSRSLRRFSGRVLRAHLRGRLLPFLDAAAGSGEAVDLQDVLKRFAFDNICGVAFGVDCSTLLELEDGGRQQHEAFFAAFDDAVEITFARILHPTTLVWRAMRLANVGSERRMREAIGVIDEYVMGMVEQLRARGGAEEQEQHLLSRFAAAMDEETALGVGGELGEMFGSPDAKRRFLRDVVVSFVLAGKDTTSSALTWFFWLLAANPRCERRVYEEVTRYSDAAGAENDNAEAEYQEELKGMQYLHAAITEAMRLYPPVPINSRVAAADDVLPDGTTVRAGWFADYSAYAMGRMPRLWGPRCREFLPERWLDVDQGDLFVAADAARYPVFHGGPRACLGKEMAYVQMKAVAAAVIRRFRVEPVRAPASMDAPPPYEMAVTLRMKGGLRVRIRRREDDDSARKCL